MHRKGSDFDDGLDTKGGCEWICGRESKNPERTPKSKDLYKSILTQARLVDLYCWIFIRTSCCIINCFPVCNGIYSGYLDDAPKAIWKSFLSCLSWSRYLFTDSGSLHFVSYGYLHSFSWFFSADKNPTDKHSFICLCIYRYTPSF